MAKYASAILIASVPFVVQRSYRVEHDECPTWHPASCDGFADVSNGILKIFGPHHSLAFTSLQVPKLVDVVTTESVLRLLVCKEDAAAACNSSDARSRK